MLTVGLTGGIGSGKSAVARLLSARGAIVIDADAVAREVVEPGTPGLARLVQEFGQRFLHPDGTLDRAALGARVFSDPAALARLNAIVHPLIGERTRTLMDDARRRDAEVVVHDVPLLVENGLASMYDAVVVVAASSAKQLERLIHLRGMSPQEAQQRMDAQASLADKLAVATHIIHNDGPLEDLVPQVERLWQALLEAARR